MLAVPFPCLIEGCHAIESAVKHRHLTMVIETHHVPTPRGGTGDEPLLPGLPARSEWRNVGMERAIRRRTAASRIARSIPTFLHSLRAGRNSTGEQRLRTTP